MTKTKRALTLTAVTTAATAIALVPATAQARHVQPRPQLQVTSVTGQANFTQLTTHDQVSINARGVFDDGSGTFQIRSDAGRADGKIICVAGSRNTAGFSDAAIGVHINRSTIAGLPRGTDAIEYVRDGGRNNPDASGLMTGTANCPDAGFSIPDGVLVQVPDQGNSRFDNGHGRFDRGNGHLDRNRHRHGGKHGQNGYQVHIRG